RPRSILETLGEEIIRIVTPVSICMVSVVFLVSVLASSSGSSSPLNNSSIGIVTVDSSIWEKLKGAVLSSLIFVAVVTAVTFLLVLLFYLRCTKFLKYYMGFSAFLVLGFMGGETALFLIRDFDFPIDCITFIVLLFNFSVVGVMAVSISKFPIFTTQTYLVVIGILVAYWFTLLPEWTTWILLVAMALYDLAAVLLPGGPLRILVELAISRDEDIPALVYEARPVVIANTETPQTRSVWRRRMQNRDEEEEEAVAPLLTEESVQGIGLGSSGAIKLGLGDFIFYSVLAGRAAMYDLMAFYACYLAVVAGLGITLLLLAAYRKALPALPFSVLLGVVFYLFSRFLLQVFLVQCSLNLLMF
ncbi:hypothetical protein M569_08428, partial [Genlisea aurea]